MEDQQLLLCKYLTTTYAMCVAQLLTMKATNKQTNETRTVILYSKGSQQRARRYFSFRYALEPILRLLFEQIREKHAHYKK